MATHSSTLAWRIPWREEPGRLLSMGSQRVGHDSATSLHFTQLPRGFPGGSVVKKLPANKGELGSIPASGKSLEEEVATHSSILACETPWTEDPGRLPWGGKSETQPSD